MGSSINGNRPSVRRQIKVLMEMIRGLHEEIIRIGQQTSEGKIKEIAKSMYAKEDERLSKLRDDAVRVINLLKEKGIVTHEEVNRAISGTEK